MSVRTAAAVLCRGPFVRQRSGGQGSRWRNGRPRATRVHLSLWARGHRRSHEADQAHPARRPLTIVLEAVEKARIALRFAVRRRRECVASVCCFAAVPEDCFGERSGPAVVQIGRVVEHRAGETNSHSGAVRQSRPDAFVIRTAVGEPLAHVVQQVNPYSGWIDCGSLPAAAAQFTPVVRLGT